MKYSKSSRSTTDSWLAPSRHLLFMFLSLALVIAVIMHVASTKTHYDSGNIKASEKFNQRQALDDGNNTNANSQTTDINEFEPPLPIEAPYIGMSESWIAKTLMGEPGYTEWIVGGNSYTFYLDDGYAWLVKTNNEKVCMIQYFQNGKLLGSTTETGNHEPLFP